MLLAWSKWLQGTGVCVVLYLCVYDVSVCGLVELPLSGPEVNSELED